jgi:hypothetical protein
MELQRFTLCKSEEDAWRLDSILKRPWIWPNGILKICRESRARGLGAALFHRREAPRERLKSLERTHCSQNVHISVSLNFLKERPSKRRNGRARLVKLEECKLAVGSTGSGSNVKLLEWMIEHLVIKILTKLEKKSPSHCQDISQKAGETGKI